LRKEVATKRARNKKSTAWSRFIIGLSRVIAGAGRGSVYNARESGRRRQHYSVYLKNGEHQHTHACFAKRSVDRIAR
jgi:hypothetical protein